MWWCIRSPGRRKYEVRKWGGELEVGLVGGGIELEGVELWEGVRRDCYVGRVWLRRHLWMDAVSWTW